MVQSLTWLLVQHLWCPLIMIKGIPTRSLDCRTNQWGLVCHWDAIPMARAGSASWATYQGLVCGRLEARLAPCIGFRPRGEAYYTQQEDTTVSTIFAMWVIGQGMDSCSHKCSKVTNQKSREWCTTQCGGSFKGDSHRHFWSELWEMEP